MTDLFEDSPLHPELYDLLYIACGFEVVCRSHLAVT